MSSKSGRSSLLGLLFLGAAAMIATNALAEEAAKGASSASGVQAGFLTCNVDSGWGFIIGSSRELKCTWEPQKGVAYRYKGHVTQFGADIGYHKSSVILW